MLKPPSTARTAGRSDWAERRFRRQPFILLSFSSSKKARKAQETQPYQRFQCIGHTDFKDLSSAVTPPLPCFHQWVKLVLAQSPTKRPTFAFTGESGYTLAFRRRIAHNGLHTETGGVSDGVVSLPSERSARSETSPGRVSERQILPLLGLGRGDSRRTQRACGTVMRLCASLFRRRRGPAGLRDLFLLLPKLRLLRSAHTGPFRVCEAGVVSLPSARFARCRNAGRPLVKVVYLPFSCVPY